MKKVLKIVVLVLVIAFALAQFARPNRTNPPINEANVLQMPADVQSIFTRSCADCHSNTTKWPWYTNISPVSWWIADHVKEGRHELNVSEFGTYSTKKAAHKMEEVCEMVEKGEMPLQGYAGPLHPDAHLSEADKSRLCEWAKGEQRRLLGKS
ncbi:MAG TPA: heme-binding domain-containing protein [Thermoanaerobaculia bacterium]